MGVEIGATVDAGCLADGFRVELQVRMLCGGKTHTAHDARVRHAWDVRGSKPAGTMQGPGFSGAGERAARSLDRVSRRRGPRRAAGASLEQRDLLDDA